MRHYPLALAVWLLTAALAPAHFVWILPGDPDAKKTTVQVVFSDALKPDSPELLQKIVQTELFVRGGDGKTTPFKKYTEGKADAYRADVPGEGARAVGAVCLYGVIERGQGGPFLLTYHAKTYVGYNQAGRPEDTSVFHDAWDRLALDIVPVSKRPEVRVLWKGQPLADAEVVLLVPGVDKPVERKTDAKGIVTLEQPKAGGLYGIRARHVEKKEGEHDGKKYKEARHYATFVVRFGDDKPSDRPEPEVRQRPDAEATRMLAEARAARAQWEKFPGFAADLEVYADGKTTKGRVEVSAKGQVSLKLDDPAAEAWVKRTLTSVVSHRIDNSAIKKTPCAFADQDADHPLGRAVRVLSDEFHSSYRVRDRQISVVNRQMGDVRFTISVQENRFNAEGKYLPASYVVNTWDMKTDALKSSEAHHQTWQRVGPFDLPLAATVIKASAGQQEARRLKLSNHRLMKE